MLLSGTTAAGSALGAAHTARPFAVRTSPRAKSLAECSGAKEKLGAINISAELTQSASARQKICFDQKDRRALPYSSQDVSGGSIRSLARAPKPEQDIIVLDFPSSGLSLDYLHHNLPLALHERYLSSKLICYLMSER